MVGAPSSTPFPSSHPAVATATSVDTPTTRQRRSRGARASSRLRVVIRCQADGSAGSGQESRRIDRIFSPVGRPTRRRAGRSRPRRHRPMAGARRAAEVAFLGSRAAEAGTGQPASERFCAERPALATGLRQVWVSWCEMEPMLKSLLADDEGDLSVARLLAGGPTVDTTLPSVSLRLFDEA